MMEGLGAVGEIINTVGISACLAYFIIKDFYQSGEQIKALDGVKNAVKEGFAEVKICLLEYMKGA